MRSVRWILATIASLMAWLPGQAAWAQQTAAPPSATVLNLAPYSPVSLVMASGGMPSAGPALRIDSTPATGNEQQTQTAPPTSAATQVADTTIMGPAVSTTALDTLRGGSLTFNDMQVNGNMTDTRALDVATGSNSIADGSFANASGMPMVIQNTGANVLIQNATIVNVQFKQ